MDYALSYMLRRNTPALNVEQAKKEAKDAQMSACTAAVVLSILYQEDGKGYDMKPFSLDGRTGEPISSDEIWKAWAMLAGELSHRKDLSDNKRALAASIWRAVVDAVRAVAAQEGGSKPPEA